MLVSNRHVLKKILIILPIFIAFGLSLHSQTFTKEEFAEGLLIYPDDIQYGFGVSFIDFNQDGWDDLSYGVKNGKPQFFVNNEGHFDTLHIINDEFNEAKSVSWADIDNDLDLDVFITDYNGVNRLYENQGNLVMNEITQEAGILKDSIYNSTGASWADFNNDSFLDLYVCHYSGSSSFGGFNRLYKNNGDGTFDEIAVESNTHDNLLPSFIGVWIDLNEDGLIDLHVINDRVFAPNTFYLNNGDETFDEIGSELGLDVYTCAMTNSFADFDNDGDFDFYTTTTGAGNHFLVNHGDNNFEDNLLSYNVAVNHICWAAKWMDFENDMLLDLHVSTQASLSFDGENACFLNNGLGFQQDNTIMPDNANTQYSTALGDYNNDGYSDIAGTTELSDYGTLYKNTGSAGNHYIKIDLQGTLSNPYGIGSRIEVSTGGITQTQFTMCGQDYLSQDSFVKLFGLGENSLIDSIKVKWPSGHIDTFYDLEADQTIDIVEGGSLLAEISQNGNFTICPGDSVFVSPIGDFENFEWNTGGNDSILWIDTPGVYHYTGYTQLGVPVFSDSLFVDFSDSLLYQANIQNPNCFGENSGSIELIFEDSLSLDSLAWSNLSVENGVTQLSSGIYSVQFWNTDGCLSEDSFELLEPDSLWFEASIEDVDCFGNCNGQLNLTPYGGTPNYEFFVLNEPDLEALCSGEYEITLEDSLGCLSVLDIEILEPDELVLNLEIQPIDDENMGSALIEIDGGTLPYQIEWSNGENSNNLDNLDQNSYWVEVIDYNGCEIYEEFEIALSSHELGLSDAPILHPNPADDIIHIQNLKDHCDIKIYSSIGELVYSETTNKDSKISISSFSAGLYFVTINSLNSMSQHQLIVK